ncbi:MAG: hypothetical protein DRR42_11640 [Gammaproteobacteria bacterium]|nr:MAG: hypothetical protein DRR42_11640 [Gammaproteobacteria bacterium]
MINIEQAKVAIESYFSSEAAEMYCILSGSALLALCSLLLWFKFSDQFSVALAITLVLIALLLAATGISLLIRDRQNHQGLTETLNAGDLKATEQVLGIERVRMQKVADNYQNLRYTFSALALAGALLIAFTHHHITHAIAIGLLIFALSGLVIDRYSEVRARLYLGNLQAQN